MVKSVDDSVPDAALNRIATATAQHACSAAPANQAGLAAVSLASTPMSSGDYTIANGDVSGRKMTMASKSGSTISSTGTANHTAFTDGTTLLLVTEATPQALTAGNPITFGSFDYEIEDPT